MKISTLILIFIIIYGCAGPTKINVAVALNPRNPEVMSYRRLAVLPYSGRFGREFASKVEAMIIAQKDSSGNPYYSLVERAEVARIVDEMKFSTSYLVDQNTAVEIGKLLGARAIMVGSVNSFSVQDNPYQEKRVRCGQYQNNYIKGPYGPITIPVCIRWDPYYVNCVERTANMSVSSKIISVETGSIIYSSDYSDSEKSAACSDSGYAVKSSSELEYVVQNRILNNIKMDILPYKVDLSIVLKEDDDNIKNSKSREKFYSGLEFAKSNRLDRACELWKEAYETDKESVSLTYNLGVCSEAFGDPLLAQEYYKKADKLISKPDKIINDALFRISNIIKNKYKN
ncbi:CsgG/HfaB family protein [Calditerrivibrio sp.]|uniref:CsgG/HfaB family protein n=1 Tax=Calditerrivibrio sp. TaxID=2792612 RepID=UPI003D11E7F2